MYQNIQLNITHIIITIPNIILYYLNYLFNNTLLFIRILKSYIKIV